MGSTPVDDVPHPISLEIQPSNNSHHPYEALKLQQLSTSQIKINFQFQHLKQQVNDAS